MALSEQRITVAALLVAFNCVASMNFAKCGEPELAVVGVALMVLWGVLGVRETRRRNRG